MEHTAEISIGLRRNPKEALAAALSKLTTTFDMPKESERIIIKPSIYDPNLVGNTDPRLVRAIANNFKALGSISIVESDNPIRTAEEAFEKMEYRQLVHEIGDLLNLSKLPVESLIMSGYYFDSLEMPTIFKKPHFLVNVPTLKLEPEICTVGGGVKNLFGLIPTMDKRQYHSQINKVLLDLLIAIRPHLTVMDLTSLVIGDRVDGLTKKIGAVIVSTDPIAIDAFCSDLLGIDPAKIPHLKKAYDLGLGEIYPDMMKISGTDVQKANFFELFQF
jgi:uncharacterized protein (DUF362 family)